MDQRTRHTDDEADADHDLTNGRWLEQEFADALDQWGYLTARNEHIFEPETDVIARRDELRGEPDDFLVVEYTDWHKTPVQRDAVEAIVLRATRAGYPCSLSCATIRVTYRIGRVTMSTSTPTTATTSSSKRRTSPRRLLLFF
ncbi:hypothetical protein [Halorubrum amylolyticum]|uniref:hypothetical protein n=1 Tax=Halorubrum amylolyticum TaxID=2508724 RepID=UPI001F51104B|nr:hypothetical protein [Halorubrum amylolyticum]